MHIKLEDRREKWCDISKGIVICLMIIGHSASLYPDIIREMIYSFHMPFFFMISGYWFDETKYSTRSYLIKKVKRLLLPYICFSAVFLVIRIIVFNLGADDIKSYIISICFKGYGVSTEWFFLALFEVEIITFLLFKYLYYDKAIIMIFLLSLFGIQASVYDIHYPFLLDVSLTSLLLYGTGRIIKLLSLDKNLNYKWLVLNWGFAFAICYFKYGYIWELVQNKYSNLFLGLIIALSGALITIKISRWIVNQNSIIGNFLEGIGKWSLWIYPLSKFLPDTFKGICTKHNFFGLNVGLIKIAIYILTGLLIWVLIIIVKLLRAFRYNRTKKAGGIK